MRARRAAAIALSVGALTVAAGCGGSSSSSGAKDPLDNALGYLPESAPLAAAIDTNPKGSQWQSLTTNLHKFPFADEIESSIRSSVEKEGLSFDSDIKPLLGNELVIGAPTVQGLLQGNTQIVAAIEVKDKDKLSKVLAREKNVHKDDTSNGATLYRTSDGEAAQDGDVLLFANSRQQVVAALEQHDRADRLTERDFDNRVSGLPSDALLRLYVDAGSLIQGSPAALRARRVKWVAALRTVGLTASSRSDGISLDFDIRTDPSQLTNADLPLAPGDASPPVADGSGEIALGFRGLAQSERFGEAVARVVDPSGYARFERQKRQLGAALGVDIDRDLIGQLSGNSSVVFDTSGHFALRADPKDPPAFSKALAKVARAAPSFARGAGLEGARITRVHGLYKLTGRDGKTIYYGMVGKVFAASNDPARLAQIAAQTPHTVPGAKGAFAVDVDAGKLVAGIVSQAAGGGIGGSLGGSVVSAPLGHLTGWASSSTSGIKGHLNLEIK